MKEWLRALPKAELHLHIEGTLEPELLLELAERNNVAMPYEHVDDVRAAYELENLQSLLDLYYQGMALLRDAEDFYALARDYFRGAHADGVVHVELSCDPQAHLVRGVALEPQFDGLRRAMHDAEREWGMSSALIMSFLRDESAASALDVLQQAEPWYEHIVAVGRDSAEQGNPPEKFSEVFAVAKARGLPRTAHAGEEG